MGESFFGEISKVFEILSGCLSNSLRSLSIGGSPEKGYCFTGQIPNDIGEFKSLVFLSLVYHKISGPIPISIGKLSTLEVFYIHNNQLNGSLPKTIGSLSNLQYLDLSYNNLNGPLPKNLGSLSNLESLSISNNQVNGSLPESLGSLSNLKHLDISSNHLEGQVSEVHFANLTKLRNLLAYENKLSLKVSLQWTPPFHLHEIEFGSWNLGPQFPMWLESQTNFSTLDLSNTGIADAIPSWFWNLSTTAEIIDLSQNQIYGEISYMDVASDVATILILHSNNFTGSVPRISSQIIVLDLSNNSLSGDISHLLCHPTTHSNNLIIFYLNNNLISGEIPDCWKYWPLLAAINFNNNNLTGKIPSSLGSLGNITLLFLRNNSLEGSIPNSIQSCSKLIGLDFSLNKLVGTIPKWIGSLVELRLFGVRSNKLNGFLPFELCALRSLQILDVGYNKLSGTIPKCFKNLTAMTFQPQNRSSFYPFTRNGQYMDSTVLVIKGRERQFDTLTDLVTYLDLSSNIFVGEIPKEVASLQGLRYLNLSGNGLRGSIPDKIGNLTWLESLDLSMNKLSGKIPPSMSSLSFLSYLNLSYNNLSGRIPTSTQLQSLTPSSFIGNSLYGPPLTKDDREGDPKTTHEHESSEYGEREEKADQDYWFRLGISVGFGVGFLGVICPLLFCRIWRIAYFWFFQEYLWYKILDCFIKIKYTLKT
ncbi:receptor-like protein EIX2 [Humulus lupulus]|uniref:receptor-like protein EIX2 n=1 Tax=Humulus lupulus TaxID=3486 RepID=UPI002B413413|nr:receptor-like protein EIX2 [Humulus lupulus]